ISTGGTYLVEHYDLEPRIFELKLVISAGKRPVFFTQSLGPFLKERNRRALLSIFMASSLILLLCQKSYAHLVDMGVPPERLHVSSDAVFGLAKKKPAEVTAPSKASIRKVAVSVRHWSHFTSGVIGDRMSIYKRGVANAVSWLIKRYNCQVVF